MLYKLLGVLIESPKYSPLFFEKRENIRICFAQKTPKNKCLNILKNGMCKLYFREIIRAKVLLNISEKQNPETFGETIRYLFWLNICRFVLYQLLGVLMESPKYSPLFFGKRENMSKYSIA